MTPAAGSTRARVTAAALRLIPRLHRATHRVGLLLERELAMTQAEAHVLAHLAERPEATVGALHLALAHRRSTLTSVLDRLETRGWVTRRIATGDRRSFEVVMTAAGSRAARRVHAVLARIERDLERSIGAHAAAALGDALEQLAGH